MPIVNVYLTFNGNCEDAFNFYKSVFGGEFGYMGRFKDMPSPEKGGLPFPEEEGDRIMHVSLPISKETTIMGSDTGGEWSARYKQGNNITISITAYSKEEADRLFNALAKGGNITMPLQNTFWGDYFGTLVDQFGINWMMSYNEARPKN